MSVPVHTCVVCTYSTALKYQPDDGDVKPKRIEIHF